MRVHNAFNYHLKDNKNIDLFLFCKPCRAILLGNEFFTQYFCDRIYCYILCASLYKC